MPRHVEPEQSSGFIKHPVAAAAACFALGIVLARALPASQWTLGESFGFAAVCLLVGLVALRLGWPQTSFLLVLAGFASAGSSGARLFELRFPPDHISRLATLGIDLNDPVRLEGRVVSTPFRTPYGLQLDLNVERLESGRGVHNLSGKVRLRLQGPEDAELAAATDSLKLHFGDSIRVVARLRKPRVYQNPGSFDFRRWMESIEDITWVGTVKSPLLVEKLTDRSPLGISAWIERTRRHLLEGIDRLYSPWSAEGRSGAVLKAVLLGDRSALDSDTIENFRKTGLYHLLVISGLHVGLLALVAGFFLRLIRLSETWRSALVLGFLLAYAALVEQRAPTLRATLMIVVYLLGRFLYRERAALNAIGVAALMLLLLRPAWLFESGFELSFSAALLITVLAGPILDRTTEPYRRALAEFEQADRDAGFAPRLAQFRLDMRAFIEGLKARVFFFRRRPELAAAAVVGPVRAVLWALGMLLFSFILQLGLLLPMAETFHRVTFSGIGLNALAIPLMTLLLGFAVPTVLLAAITPTLAAWPAKIVAFLMSALFALTDLPNLPAWLSYRVPAPPVWVSWGFALAVVIAAWSLGRYRRVFWAGVAAFVFFATLISLYPFAPRLPRGSLEVTALDCGGDALFLVFPDQTTMLVDGGGSRSRTTREGAFQGRRWDPGEDIVSPYLWSRGVKKIDFLVLTHAHQDHLGGLGAVARNFRLEEFLYSTIPATPDFQNLLEQLRRSGVPRRRVSSGDLIERRGTSVHILWPPPGRANEPVPSNDDSVVMLISHGAESVLLPGDISGEVERELVASDAPLRSLVLKAAHHGSRTSSIPEFLRWLSPRVALVTAEKGNLLNLPNPEALARLEAAGAQVFRPDLDGAVTVEMRGNALVVRSYRAVAEGTAGAAAAGPTETLTLRVP